MKLYGKYADLESLNSHVVDGYINKRAHLSEPDVFVYNYSPIAQFTRNWDEHILQARGLVVRDTDGLILGRGLSKFFNYEELEGQGLILSWDKPFIVTTKEDGSCFMVSGKYSWTRGSFDSTQAQGGRELLAQYQLNLDPDITYVMEYIAPDNRIVVDYYGERKLILLAMIETATGRELPLDYNLGLEVVVHHEVPHGESPAATLAALDTPNAEGFVVRFYDDSRIKIKFETYKRLHRIVTGVSTKSIWESLRTNQSLNEMLEMVPDEFNIWASSVIEELNNEYQEVEREGLNLYIEVKDMPTRRDQALRILALKSRAAFVAFKMLDGKSYADGIWKMVEPEYRQPFSSRESI